MISEYIKRKIRAMFKVAGFTVVRNVKACGTMMPLKQEHVQNCKFVETREKLLEYLPAQSICAEIGVLKGDFSEKILNTVKPRKLHLIDINETWIKNARERFADRIDKQVFLHHGNSFEVMEKFDNEYFDWVYIDAHHGYEYVKKDLEIAMAKVKKNGLIVLNDYILYDHLAHCKYGVVEAVNEFCNKYNYEIIYFAFQIQMFNDVVLRKR